MVAWARASPIPSLPLNRAFHLLLTCLLVQCFALGETTFSLSGSTPVGFAGSEIEIPIRAENRGASREVNELSIRLWQRASSTKQPLGPAVKWREIGLEGGAAVMATVKVKLPEVHTAVALSVQILSADGVPQGELPLVVIPKDWFASQIAALPQPLMLHDPEALLTPALEKMGVKFTASDHADRAEAATVVLVSSEPGRIEGLAETLATRGLPTVLLSTKEVRADVRRRFVQGTIGDFKDLADSAQAQHRFVTLLSAAFRAKAANRE
jgi:hypothetical protein